MSHWNDGTPKSTGNAFCIEYKPGKKPTWSQKLSNHKKSSMKQSKLVSEKQAEGTPLGGIYGLSRKADEALTKSRHGGAYSTARAKEKK